MTMFRALFKDRSGVSAVEFALVAPILAGVIALGWNVWQGEQSVEQAKTALRAGAMYYTSGGDTDLIAQAVVKSAWSSAPTNASVGIARACYCSGSATDCTVGCASGQTRTAYVTISVSGTGQGVFGAKTISQQEVVRVE
jgi:Flp pilus assembly protein TadG